MKVVIDIPDKYFKRWLEFSDSLGFDSYENFIIQSMGIGVRTMEQVSKNNIQFDNVISFNPDYLWSSSEK